MQHKKYGLIWKIATGVVLLLTFLIGVQGALVGLLGFNLFTVLSSGAIKYIRVYYLVTGIATIIASIILFVKVYLKK